jgi:uncharacterized protein (DUF4415 family)
MKESYDFSGAERGAVIPAKGKTRITLWLDDAVLGVFRERSAVSGKGYQTLINEALRRDVDKNAPVTETTLRRVIREELGAA